MGRSLKSANLTNSAANFHEQKPVYDEYKNLYYLPFSINDKLFIKEFRLAKNSKDTIYIRIEEINYIIGSGQHTNSHLMQKNGYLHQMPLTYYAQKDEWHLPPGFENGGNTSFERTIEVECITCHNGYPKYVEGSKNKYNYIPEGIDCERCHGPGSIHAKEKMSGKIIDISKETDYSIVNPKKLSPKLQMDVCQRCHLQGISVLKDGKTFYDFKPGMDLNEIFEVYQSRFTDSLSSFLMASHPDRLRMSKCYIESNKNDSKDGLTCITCHNPHVSVKDVDHNYFNSKCNSCHLESKCTESIDKRNLVNNNCVECHMSTSATYDIPHVNITDHNISKNPILRDVNKGDITKSEYEKQKDFIKLVCRTSENPNNKSNAIAYLNYYEKYAYNPILLDKALEYLENYTNQKELFKDYIRLYFLKNNYKKVIEITEKENQTNINDEWTAYRIGQSYMNLKNYNKALKYLNIAYKIAPNHIDFAQKLANCYSATNTHVNALKILNKLNETYPNNASVQNDLGYSIVVNAMQGNGNIKDCEKHFINAINLDPDIIKGYENLISYYINQKNKEKAKQYLNILQNSKHLEKSNYSLLNKAVKEM